MDYLTDLTQQRNIAQLTLVVLFVIYLVIGYRMPDSIAYLIDTNVGKVVVALAALSLFAYSNPILGILGIFVAYQLIQRSTMTTGNAGLDVFTESERKKWSPLSANNQFPYTLEQEVVKKMTNLKFNDTPTPASYTAFLDETYDAAPLTK
jgi:hypothetical protein